MPEGISKFVEFFVHQAFEVLLHSESSESRGGKVVPTLADQTGEKIQRVNLGNFPKNITFNFPEAAAKGKFA